MQSPARLVPYVLLALAAALMLLLSGGLDTANAQQTPRVLVGNFAVMGAEIVTLTDRDYSQAFTTGTSSNGYVVTSIQVQLTAPTGGVAPTVKLFSGSATGTELATFTLQGNLVALTRTKYTFTPSSNPRLNPSTTYWVRVEGGNPQPNTNTSTDEDASSAPGWTIANSLHYRASGSTGEFNSTATGILRMQVNGYVYSRSPTRPTEVSVASGHHQLWLNWSAPRDNGTEPITKYQYRVYKVNYFDCSGDNCTHPNPRIVPAGTEWIDVPGGASARRVTVMGLEFSYVFYYILHVRAVSRVGAGEHGATNGRPIDGSPPDGGTLTPHPASKALVSNLAQPVTSEFTPVNGIAQSFTTGPSEHGYLLTQVEVRLAHPAIPGTPPTMSLRRGSPAGTEVGTLTRAALDAGSTEGTIYGYTAADPIDLSPSTTYWVVLTGANATWKNTVSKAQDSSPEAGWSIGNQGMYRASGAASFTDFVLPRVFMMRVHGSVTPHRRDAPGSTSSTRTVEVGGQTTGAHHGPSDTDWFKVRLTANTVYQFEVRDSRHYLWDPHTQTRLQALSDRGGNSESAEIKGVYDSTGSQVTTDFHEISIYKANKVAFFTPSTTGDYYISVGVVSGGDWRSVRSGAPGTYTLVAKLADECPDSNSTTCSVAVGGSFQGYLHQAYGSPRINDVDRVELTGLVAGGIYEVRLYARQSHAHGAGDNLVLNQVFDQNGSTDLITGGWQVQTSISIEPQYRAHARFQVDFLTYTVDETNNPIYVKFHAPNSPERAYTLSLVQVASLQIVNSPPTGVPDISGTRQVGQTVTADTSGIADPDGLTNPGFTYQWVRVNLTDFTETTVGTGETYVLAPADAGNVAIKVVVTFTDDAGTEETLSSNAYTVLPLEPIGGVGGGALGEAEDEEEPGSAAQEAAEEAGLTATIHDKPASDSHDGNAFTFELRFSETPAEGFSYTTIRDHAFTVTGGSVTYVRRLEAGKNLRWEITVTPSGDGNVVLSSPATTDCNAEGAICTEDGEKFSGLSKFTISGPASQQQSSDDDQNGENDQNDGNDEGSQDDESDETPVSLPSAPTGLTATVNSNGSITLTWNNPNDDTITGYQILRRRLAEGEGTLSVYVANTNRADTTYTDTDVTAGTQHVYRIKAINSAGTGPRSSYVNVDP